MKYKEPLMNILEFMLDDVITGSPGDLYDDDVGGDGGDDDEVVDWR